MIDFERLGAFYLGTTRDSHEVVLYDARDLTTHALCVGMTGSGKTGLGIALIEEAAIDGVPAIVVDPKGDMADLMLSFPDLSAESFEPWVSADEAARAQVDRSALAADVAARWREGLAQSGQSPERITRMRDTTTFALYTPGAVGGRPLSIVTALEAPGDALTSDPDAFSAYVATATEALLGLLGLTDVDQTDRSYALVSALFQDAWSRGESLSLKSLIDRVTTPPFQDIGVMSVESFFPKKERFDLAVRLNTLLASPRFRGWTQGEPLEIDRLLYTDEGRPKVSIVTLAHLSEHDRMFFVTELLNRLVAWVRRQPGTSSLRALFYMDELAGYMPPVASPPSKRPLLTLLKQARAQGLGLVLTTQNPVDLDYKGLANIGTWWIGTLSTKQDKARLLDGLEGASESAFDRAEMDRLLSTLGPREFCMRNVHENGLTTFRSRFALSYLAGPIVGDPVRMLARQARPDADASASSPEATAPAAEIVPPATDPEATAPAAETVPPATDASDVASPMAPPTLPPDIKARYLPTTEPNVHYRPAVFAWLDVYYQDKGHAVNHHETIVYAAPLGDGMRALDWNDTTKTSLDLDRLSDTAPAGFFEALPDSARKVSSYTTWTRDVIDHVHRTAHLTLPYNEAFGLVALPGEGDAAFRVRLDQAAREERDKELDALKARYEAKRATLEGRVHRASQAVEREEQQAGDSTLQTAISVGATLLGAFLGRRRNVSSTLGRATTAARSASRTARQKGDVTRAKATLERSETALDALDQDFEQDVADIRARYDAKESAMTTLELTPQTRDIKPRVVGLVWLPYVKDAQDEWREAW